MLKEHLSPGGAWHRAHLDGQQWTNTESLLWGIWHKLDHLDARLVWQKRKRPKWPKFKTFPWSKDKLTVGDRGEATSQDVVDYLRSIAPPSST
ncbi:hypothetical protein SAMN05444374_11626 [Rhodococcoides kroppenstedtii]|uniref:Uncharacterized protein n=1 Tax=Rhodococcoides kroppenstedtii TaxID=293050 RepID=A0A1I0UAE8_9NOCA|nr:hypothetical protein SAMN05444374_11626 [Rhodococcus kroppenstedtii]